jgi:hypothetical protein
MFAMLFLLLLISVVGYSLLFGGAEERIVVLVLLSGSALTLIFYDPKHRDWLSPQLIMIVLDGTALVVFVVLALRSKRFWPLWVAAFQAMPVLTHFAATVSPYMVSKALGVAQGLWAYLQLLVVFAVTYRRRIGIPTKRTPGS